MIQRISMKMKDESDGDDLEYIYMKSLDGNGRGSVDGNEGRDGSENRSEDKDGNGGKDINGDAYNEEEFRGNDNEGRDGENSQKKQLARNKRKLTKDESQPWQSRRN